MEKRKGFTLVELLVVIAIIALLMSILMPALSKVRKQARLLSCMANCRQIGAIMTAYQADNDGCVPVMRNKWAIYINAETSLLSLPFRNYSERPKKLPMFLQPKMPWTWDKVLDYSQNYLPDFYVCPFVRGKSQADIWRPDGPVEVCPGVVRQNCRSTGRGDSYSTWIWPRPKNYDFWPGEHCYGPDHGKNKYGNLVWHTGGEPLKTGCSANQKTCEHGKFDQVHVANFSTIRGISERTAVYCAHGEIDESSHGSIINYGSHKRMNRGGTNVIFGDSHVEWVQGSQITAW